MDQKRAWFYFILLTWGFITLLGIFVYQSTHEPTQPSNQKAGLIEKVDQGKVLAGGTFYYGIVLKDSSNNQAITSGATIILTSPRDVLSCWENQFTPTWTFEFGPDPVIGDHWYLGCSQVDPRPNATVTITKPGYKTKTTSIVPAPDVNNVSIDPADTQPPTAPGNLRTTSVTSTSAALAWNASTDNVGVTGYKVFRDNKQIATSTKTSYTDSSLQPATSYNYFVKAYDADGNLSGASNTITVATTLTIKDVGLPTAFTQAGSSTTNLAAIADPKNVTNLTVEVVGKNKIVWNETVDLSSMETANKFKSLDQYIKATNTGVVELDSKNLAELNKKTTITMFNLPFVSTPKILVDGKVNPKVVSDISYKNGTLAFTAAHFTKFEVAPTIEILEPKDNFTTSKSKITLYGKVSNPTATVSATLNNKDLGAFKVAAGSGEFSKQIALEKGKNTIVVRAKGLIGATASATVSGVFKPTVAAATLLLIVGLVVLIATLGLGGYYFYRRKAKAKPAQTQ